MCRSKSESGRRCPCSSPERRSAYRKTKGLLDQQKTIGEGGTTRVDISGEPKEQSITERWQPEKMAELYELIDNSLYVPRDPGESRETRMKRIENTNRRLHELGANRSVEILISRVGEAVACEAERRAGVTAEQIHDDAEKYIADCLKKSEELKNKVESTEDYRIALEARKDWDDACKDDSTSIEERMEKRDRMREARQKVEYSEDYIEGERVAQEATNGLGPNTKDQMRRLSDAYLEVLREVRPFGGSVEFDGKTKKAAAAAFQEAAEYFPSDWVNASNASPAKPLARISTTRAHYSSSMMKPQKRKERASRKLIVDNVEEAIKRYEESPDPSRTYRKLNDKEWEEYQKSSPYSSREEIMMVEEWETWSMYGRDVDENDPPKGRGWEIAEDRKGRKLWRRPSYKIRTVGTVFVPEMKTNASKTGLVSRENPYSQVATHEFTHRCEDMMSTIGHVEMEFLKRRTAGEVEGEREEAVAMYGGRKHRGKKEMSRGDSFAHVYMGKDYGSAKYHEVMSTGMEALFHGEYGGLVGVARHRADPDMRAFVLGTLATVGKSKRVVPPQQGF